MKAIATSLLALVAAACTPLEWVRADADPAQLQADSEQCGDAAWREASWRSMSYRSSFGPWFYRDRFGRPLLVAPFGPFSDPFTDRYMEERRLADFCMRAKGYELEPVAK